MVVLMIIRLFTLINECRPPFFSITRIARYLASGIVNFSLTTIMFWLFPLTWNLRALNFFEYSFERRERDSNPRTFWVNGFQDRRIRPLCHLSGAKIALQRLLAKSYLKIKPNYNTVDFLLHIRNLQPQVDRSKTDTELFLKYCTVSINSSNLRADPPSVYTNV